MDVQTFQAFQHTFRRGIAGNLRAVVVGTGRLVPDYRLFRDVKRGITLLIGLASPLYDAHPSLT
jgi:hypothetical protein